MRMLAAIVVALLAVAPARAGDLTISLRTPSGAPVADAVVMVAPQSGKGRPRIAGGYRMAQKDMQFQPFVLVVPVGAEVAFPNLDPVRHHVYSFSGAKAFELKLYGRDEARKVRFDKPGLVAVGCNIHDAMSGFIRVVDTAWAAKSDAAGLAVIQDLPAGAATVTIWHPHLKAPRGEVSRTVQIAGAGDLRQSLTLDLRAASMKHGHY